MSIDYLGEIYNAKLSDEEFRKLSEFIYNNFGIKMPEIKRVMLQSRLQKRLRELKLKNFKDYVDFVFSAEGQDNEVIHMIDVVSTNKTDFFREPIHFDFLTNEIVPQFMDESPNETFKIWSAGCSSGEEPYTITIVMSELQEKFPGLNYSIYATDISTKILSHAIDAIYKEDRIEGIPFDLKKKYFLKSKDRIKPTVRVIAPLRNKVTFTRLNFMDNSFHTPEIFDQIFCRNVLIYFDRKTQENVINKLCDRLKPNGFLFLGHSESITGMKLPLEQIKPTIFKKVI